MAGMTRIGGKGQPGPAASQIQAPDIIVSVDDATGDALVEIVDDPLGPLVEVVEPVTVGADTLEVGLGDLVDLDIPADLPADAPLLLVRHGQRYTLTVADESTRGGYGYTHHQLVPATLWQIQHGLAFDPAGFEVIDSEGYRTEPAEVTWPLPGVMELRFGVPVYGTAKVS